MNEAEIRSVLAAIVVKRSRLKVDVVRDDHRLAEELGFDSLAFLMAVGDLEKELAVALPLDRIDDLRELTFGGLVGLVVEQRA